MGVHMRVLQAFTARTPAGEWRLRAGQLIKVPEEYVDGWIGDGRAERIDTGEAVAEDAVSDIHSAVDGRVPIPRHGRRPAR